MVDILAISIYFIIIDIFVTVHARVSAAEAEAFKSIEGSLPEFFSSVDFIYDYATLPHGLSYLENLTAFLLVQNASTIRGPTLQTPLSLWAILLRQYIVSVRTSDSFKRPNQISGANPGSFTEVFSKLFNSKKTREILLQSARIASNEDPHLVANAKYFVHSVGETIAKMSINDEDFKLYWKEDLAQGYSVKILLSTVRESLTTSATDPIEKGFALALAEKIIYAKCKVSAVQGLNEEIMHSYRRLAGKDAQDLLYDAATKAYDKINELSAVDVKDHIFGTAFALALLRAISLNLVKDFDQELVEEGMQKSSERDTSRDAQPTSSAVCDAILFATDMYIAYTRKEKPFLEEDPIYYRIRLHRMNMLFCLYLDSVTQDLEDEKSTTFWKKALQDEETNGAAFQVYEALLLVWATVTDSLFKDEPFCLRDFDRSLAKYLEAWDKLITSCIEDTVWTSSTAVALHRTIELGLNISISKTEAMLQCLARPLEVADDELVRALMLQCGLMIHKILEKLFLNERPEASYEADSLNFLLNHRGALLLKLLHQAKSLLKVVQMPAAVAATQPFTMIIFFTSIIACLTYSTSQLSLLLDKPNPNIETINMALENECKQLTIGSPADQIGWEALRKINSNAPNGPLEDILRNQTEALNTLQCSYVGCTTLPPMGQKPKRNLCSACLRVHYCSAGCQKKDWKSHKHACRLLGKLEK